MTEELWSELISLKHSGEIRFAFDDISYKDTVIRALDIMSNNGLKKWKTKWYVYVGEKDNFNTVYERLEILRSYKQLAYLMRDKKVHDNPLYVALAKWVNAPGAFKYDLQQILKNSELTSAIKYFPKELQNGHIIDDKQLNQIPMDLNI